MKNSGITKLYKLTSAQSQLLIGTVFSLEPKKVFQDDLVDFGLYVEKDFNADAMEKAVNCLIQRNDCLRIRVCVKPYGLRQYIAPYEPTVIDRIRVKDEDAFQEALTQKTSIPLLSERLFRLTMIECDDESRSGGIHIVCHHVISDGYSLNMMHKKLNLYYSFYKDGLEPPEEKIYSVTEYFEADRKYLTGPQFKEDRKYWFRAYNRQPDYRFPAGRIPWRCSLGMDERIIGGETYAELLNLTKKIRCSLPAMAMNLTAITVYVLTGDANFCLYTLSHGRSTAKLKKTMGCMINSIPQFYNVSAEMTAESYLSAAYSDYLQVLSHSRFPSHHQILMAAKETYMKRFGYNHMWFLFSAMDYLEGNEAEELELITPQDEYIMGQFYEAFLNESSENRCRIQLLYQDRSFTEAQITHYMDVFCSVTEKIVKDPAILLSELRAKITAENK